MIAAILASSAFLASLLLFASRIASAASRRSGGNRRRRGAKLPLERSCPLCSSTLEDGERISSRLYPGGGDRIMHIFGCPRCWPSTAARGEGLQPLRICPVCGRALGREGWVVARYFERAVGAGARPKAHVHVLGCTECRK